MPLNRDDVSTLLADVHRRCCVCHRFCGATLKFSGGEAVFRVVGIVSSCSQRLSIPGLQLCPAFAVGYSQNWLNHSWFTETCSTI